MLVMVTYYVLQLLNIYKPHPGAKEELKSRKVSVCRNSYKIGQSIYGAGEQTFMKDAKTMGGVKDFATQESTYENVSVYMYKYVSDVLQQAGLKNVSDNPIKYFSTREIDKSEKAVQNIKYVLSNDFINHFSSELDTDKLFNLA